MNSFIIHDYVQEIESALLAEILMQNPVTVIVRFCKSLSHIELGDQSRLGLEGGDAATPDRDE